MEIKIYSILLLCFKSLFKEALAFDLIGLKANNVLDCHRVPDEKTLCLQKFDTCQ
jgi:hypothetical protein